MANVKTRIIQKHDSSANWAKATTFVPLKGEIIIYDDLGKIKIGDGIAKVNDLPFTNADAVKQIKLNNVAKTPNADGVVDLGTVITAHQDISGKQDKLSTAQLNAANSGITSTKVKQYDGYNTTISDHTTRLTTLEGKPGLDKTGTVSSIKINGTSKTPTNGAVDLGTVITSHQDISGKQDKLNATQLNAVDSGITNAKVKQYDSYNSTIGNHTTRIVSLEGKPGLDKVGTVVKVNNTAPDASGNVSIAIPPAVSEATVSGWGFTKNTGTYSKPSGGIPKTDLASAVQTSLGKADSAVQKVKINGAEKSPTNGVVDLGTVITAHQSLDGKQDKITENNKLSYNLLTDIPDLSNAPDIPDLSDYISLLNSDTLPDEAINYIKTFKKISGVKINYAVGKRIQVYLPLMSTQTVSGEVVRYTFLGEPTNYSGQSYISMSLQLTTKKITWSYRSPHSISTEWKFGVDDTASATIIDILQKTNFDTTPTFLTILAGTQDGADSLVYKVAQYNKTVDSTTQAVSGYVLFVHPEYDSINYNLATGAYNFIPKTHSNTITLVDDDSGNSVKLQMNDAATGLNYIDSSNETKSLDDNMMISIDVLGDIFNGSSLAGAYNYNLYQRLVQLDLVTTARPFLLCFGKKRGIFTVISYSQSGTNSFSTINLKGLTTDNNINGPCIINMTVYGNTSTASVISVSSIANVSASTTQEGTVKLNVSSIQSESAQSVTSTTNRTYSIQKAASGNKGLVVNVPWIKLSGSYASSVTSISKNIGNSNTTWVGSVGANNSQFKLITVYGDEKQSYGEIELRHGSVNVGHATGEQSYWGRQRLCVSTLIPPSTTIDIYAKNMNYLCYMTTTINI